MLRELGHWNARVVLVALVTSAACAPEVVSSPGESTATGGGGAAAGAGATAAGSLAAGGGAGSVASAGAGATANAAAGMSAPQPLAGTPGLGAAGVTGGGVAGRAVQPGLAGRSAGAGTAGSAAAGSGNAGAGVAGASAAAGTGAAVGGEFEAERQACVDTINMYRATLNLAPLKRASAELETCSDTGAKKDGDANAAHSSAGDCRPLGAQNTCPGYPVRAGSTLTATLNGCLAQMWAEGAPPNGVQACIQDRTGCFLEHGHWINMQSATSGTVACGFYKMSNGRYWMNQNFGR